MKDVDWAGVPRLAYVALMAAPHSRKAHTPGRFTRIQSQLRQRHRAATYGMETQKMDCCRTGPVLRSFGVPICESAANSDRLRHLDLYLSAGRNWCPFFLRDLPRLRGGARVCCHWLGSCDWVRRLLRSSCGEE